MEETFPGVSVYISCKDDYLYLLQNESKALGQTDLKENKNQFAYIRELACDMQSHPVEEFMNESSIKIEPICNSKITSKKTCVILTNSILPVRSLTGEQIQKTIAYARSKGCEPRLNEDFQSFDWVIGVENENLYLAASQGKNITLIPTGFGENLFKRMFPQGEILNL